MAKQSINELRNELVFAQLQVKTSSKSSGEFWKKEIRKLQARIANRERYDAMRSLGMKKTPYGWE